ncbi:MAG: type II toxin-antitoxin system PemK/MazF family toxin [Acidimicrobiales bacterium]
MAPCPKRLFPPGRPRAPVRGSEVNKTRPAVIVSNDGANQTAKRIYPFQVLLPAEMTGLERDSKAQVEQIRSVAGERTGRRVGAIPAPEMSHIDEALRLQLGL